MDAVRALYEGLLDAWNRQSAEDFANLFADDGESVGFDGSQMEGRARIRDELGAIFADHQTGKYVGKVRHVRPIGADAASLHAVAGMVPPGKTELDPDLNVIQMLVAERSDGRWQIVLYQNTPAQFHGRPELVESLTAELRAELGVGA